MKLNNVELLKFANSFADISKSILKKYYFKNFKVEEKQVAVAMPVVPERAGLPSTAGTVDPLKYLDPELAAF